MNPDIFKTLTRISPTNPVNPLPETASFRSRSQSSLFQIRFVLDD